MGAVIGSGSRGEAAAFAVASAVVAAAGFSNDGRDLARQKTFSSVDR